jgi:hypothetical protein
MGLGGGGVQVKGGGQAGSVVSKLSRASYSESSPFCS